MKKLISESTEEEIIIEYLAYQDVLQGESKDSTLQFSLKKGYSSWNKAKALKELALIYSDNKIVQVVGLLIEKLNKIFDSIDHKNLQKHTISNTWAYWDIGKQYYLLNHPNESDLSYYLLGNPIESEEIQIEIVSTMLGWELYKSNFHFDSFFNGEIPNTINILNPSHSWEYRKIGKAIMENLN